MSQFIDSFVVLFIAFYLGPRLLAGNGDPWSFVMFLAVGLNNYIYKFLLAVVLTPVIYWMHNVIDNYLGKEVAEKMKMEAGR